MAVTNSLATAYSNQKKLVTLSTGRMVAAIQNIQQNTTEFMWSDDGKVWSNYQADVLGPDNGSIAAYVDSGGVERLVFVFAQRGNTLAGRNNLTVYITTGTFNAGRTTITWGNFLDISGINAAWNYPDLVVNAEGTGGRAHVVWSMNDTSPHDSVYYAQQAISSTGIVTVSVSYGTLTGGYPVNAGTYPSIDINPITKDLYCAWSAGATGAGNGIRFKKATYSAGTWTWGSEVEVDNTTYLGASSYWIVCRWDGTRVVLGSANNDGGTNVWLKKYESTNFTSFSTTTLLTIGGAGGMYAGGMSVDITTGDIYFFGLVYSPSTAFIYYKWTRATTTLGSVVVLDSGGTNPFASAIYSGGKIRWIYTAGNNSPYQVKYDELSLAPAFLPFIGWGVPM